MKMKPLGRTGISVSEICLGSMTWGTQNTEAEGHAQMDMAVDHGVNFFDTAEMYPSMPLSRETSGRTEEIIGNWFKATGKRDAIVLATKIVGNGSGTVRDGAPVNGTTMRLALDASLKRLRTGHVDLYQIHWPNRGSYHFRQQWAYNPSSKDTARTLDDMADILQTADALVKEGKIRAFGLSNDTVWGVAKMLELAEKNGWPRIASIQNEYSLMNRLFDLDFAELSHHEEVGLMAYSPLASGTLTGKYLGGALPAGSRLSIVPGLSGRWQEHSIPAVQAYVDLAQAHRLDPAQMALAFALSRPFMMSVIIGATTMDQLKTNLGASNISLSEETMSAIAAIRRAHPMPM